MKKTNAMRYLEQRKVEYEALQYDVEDGLIDGVSVADKKGLSYEKVGKTLVCIAETPLVFVIPVDRHLDLKLAAKVAGVKKVDMLHQKDLKALTGYVHGGCSPIGMKKAFPTFVEQSMEHQEKVVVSAGAIGWQIVLSPQDLAAVTDAKFAPLT